MTAAKIIREAMERESAEAERTWAVVSRVSVTPNELAYVGERRYAARVLRDLLSAIETAGDGGDFTPTSPPPSVRERRLVELGLRYGAKGWTPLTDNEKRDKGRAIRIDPVGSIIMEVDAEEREVETPKK